MAFVIHTKVGIPIKLSDKLLIRPKVIPDKFGFRKVPYSENRGGLSNPYGPTTTNFRQWAANIPQRHADLYSRIPDRGGAKPFAGINITLPNGKIGGTNNRLTPTMLSISRATKHIVPGNRWIADKFQAVMHKTAVLTDKKFNRKVVPRIMPGAGGLDYAQAPKRYKDLWSGDIKMRSAIHILKPKGWGVFSQHRTAPWNKVNDLALKSGQKRWSLIGAQSKMGWKTKPRSEVPDITTAQGNIEGAMRIAAPTTASTMTETREGLNWVFLISVAVLGFIALRKG